MNTFKEKVIYLLLCHQEKIENEILANNEEAELEFGRVIRERRKEAERALEEVNDLLKEINSIE